MFHFEHRDEPLIPKAAFMWRMGHSIFVVCLLIGLSLAMKTEAGKIFAGLYALYSGLAFLVLAGLLFGPVAHRILHRFHYEADEEGGKS